MKRSLLISLIVGVMASGAWAAKPTTQPGDLDELIRQGDQKREEKQPAKPAVEARPGDQAQPAEGAKPGSEEAAKGEEEEDDDLATALLKKASGEGKKPIMDEIIGGMGSSRDKLRQDYNVGEVTQKIQDQIIKNLDQAIEDAASASSSSKSQGKQEKQGEGKAQGPPKPGDGKPGPPQKGGMTPAAEDTATQGGVPNVEAQKQALEQGRKEWGSLPERDRSDVVQGQSEKMLTRWESLIKDYYTALQVQSQNKE